MCEINRMRVSSDDVLWADNVRICICDIVLLLFTTTHTQREANKTAQNRCASKQNKNTLARCHRPNMWLMVAISHETSLCLSLANYCLLLFLVSVFGWARIFRWTYFSDRVIYIYIGVLLGYAWLRQLLLYGAYTWLEKIILAVSGAAAIIVMYGKRTNWPREQQQKHLCK